MRPLSRAVSVGADEFIERLPRGFDTMFEEKMPRTSLGQRPRLAIAGAVAGLVGMSVA